MHAVLERHMTDASLRRGFVVKPMHCALQSVDKPAKKSISNGSASPMHTVADLRIHNVRLNCVPLGLPSSWISRTCKGKNKSTIFDDNKIYSTLSEIVNLIWPSNWKHSHSHAKGIPYKSLTHGINVLIEVMGKHGTITPSSMQRHGSCVRCPESTPWSLASPR